MQSRFYLAEEPSEGRYLETRSRLALMVRGLRRAVSLYQGLIEEQAVSRAGPP